MAQTGIPALELPQRRDGQQDLILNLDDGKCIGSDWLILWAVPRRGRNTTGPIAVSKVSNGRANIAEVGAGCASDPMERLSRRLLDPRTHQWSIWWANRADGILDRVPTVGTFENGRGEFSSFQPIEGRWVLVRFIFSAVTTNSMHGEQAHSTDGGKTWAPNWIEDLTREEKAMVIEMRTYKLKPGCRKRFLDVFRAKSMPAHAEIGMKLLGPWLSIEDEDTFFFMRGFPDLESRDPMKAKFYEGELWKEELENVLLPMIEKYDVVLVEDPEGLIAWR